MRKKGSWWSKKHRDYKYGDKQKGYAYSFTLDQARAIMELPCYYCSKGESKGIDRLDNDKGHETGNVVPCCEKCNIILGTLPYLAKLEMREALRRIYEKDLLKDWQPVYRVAPKKKEEQNEELALDIELEATETSNENSTTGIHAGCDDEIERNVSLSGYIPEERKVFAGEVLVRCGFGC